MVLVRGQIGDEFVMMQQLRFDLTRPVPQIERVEPNLQLKWWFRIVLVGSCSVSRRQQNSSDGLLKQARARQYLQ